MLTLQCIYPVMHGILKSPYNCSLSVNNFSLSLLLQSVSSIWHRKITLSEEPSFNIEGFKCEIFKLKELKSILL